MGYPPSTISTTTTTILHQQPLLMRRELITDLDWIGGELLECVSFCAPQKVNPTFQHFVSLEKLSVFLDYKSHFWDKQQKTRTDV